MSSQIRSNTEYLVPTANILVLLLHSNLTQKFTYICRCIAIYRLFGISKYFLGHAVVGQRAADALNAAFHNRVHDNQVTARKVDMQQCIPVLSFSTKLDMQFPQFANKNKYITAQLNTHHRSRKRVQHLKKAVDFLS